MLCLDLLKFLLMLLCALSEQFLQIIHAFCQRRVTSMKFVLVPLHLKETLLLALVLRQCLLLHGIHFGFGRSQFLRMLLEGISHDLLDVTDAIRQGGMTSLSKRLSRSCRVA
eukprot:Skav219678  [mRNA]  locus=scaffold817:11498:13773:+ [translate_table: standard]